MACHTYLGPDSGNVDISVVSGAMNVVPTYVNEFISTSIYCDWLAKMIVLVLWEISRFSRYTAEFSAGTCESNECLYTMCINIMQA